MDNEKLKYYLNKAGEWLALLLLIHAIGVHIPLFSDFVNDEVMSFNEDMGQVSNMTVQVLHDVRMNLVK